jgi:2-methylcitrate dehydratase PrpD
MLDGAGRQWLAIDIAFKPYACGTMAHPYIDCARKLVSEGVAARDVISIECKTAEGIVHRLWEPLAAKPNPPNGYAAKFSIPYAIAVGMLRGDAGLVEYEEAVVHDLAVRALAAKVRYTVDPDNPYPRQFTGHMRVTLKSGQVREASQGYFRGGREAPMSAEALEAKSSLIVPMAAGTKFVHVVRSPCCHRYVTRRRSIYRSSAAREHDGRHAT